MLFVRISGGGEMEKEETRPMKKKRARKKQENQVGKLQKRRRRREGWKSFLYLAPSLCGLCVFFILPFLVVIYYSVINNTFQHELVFLDNFIQLLENDTFLDAAWNTARFSMVFVPLAVVLSLLIAVMLDRTIPFRSQIRSALLSPMMVPVASVVLIFQVVFHYNGTANLVLEQFGIARVDWFKSDYSQLVVGIMFLWKNLGYNMILFMAALANIPRDLLEVLSLDSTSRWMAFWYVKIRYLSPTILFVTILSLINSFKIFREVYLLTGDYPYDSLYMLQNFMNNTFESMNYQKLSAAALLMAVVMIVIIGVMFVAEGWFGKDVEG